MYVSLFFFFFKQKTAYEMRISDWSSDVCSSDLLNLPERQVPIRVGFAEAALDNPGLVGQLRVRGKNGPVPLSSVADIRMASGPSQISRYQRQRNVTFTAELNGRPLGEVMNEVQALPSVQHLPAGGRSEEHTAELQSLMRTSYAVFCLKKKNNHYTSTKHNTLLKNQSATYSNKHTHQQ